MALTPKQERNGISVEGGTQSQEQLAQPGPMVTPPVGQAMAAAERTMAEAHDLFVGGGADGAGTQGSVPEWDSGLAVNDVEGGGSG